MPYFDVGHGHHLLYPGLGDLNRGDLADALEPRPVLAPSDGSVNFVTVGAERNELCPCITASGRDHRIADGLRASGIRDGERGQNNHDERCTEQETRKQSSLSTLGER